MVGTLTSTTQLQAVRDDDCPAGEVKSELTERGMRQARSMAVTEVSDSQRRMMWPKPDEQLIKRASVDTRQAGLVMHASLYLIKLSSSYPSSPHPTPPSPPHLRCTTLCEPLFSTLAIANPQREQPPLTRPHKVTGVVEAVMTSWHH